AVEDRKHKLEETVHKLEEILLMNESIFNSTLEYIHEQHSSTLTGLNMDHLSLRSRDHSGYYEVPSENEQSQEEAESDI
ncbi:hypothetical protein ACFLRC_04585, partial [Candidatus Altiarchaeota archaeon]